MRRFWIFADTPSGDRGFFKVDAPTERAAHEMVFGHWVATVCDARPNMTTLQETSINVNEIVTTYLRLTHVETC